MMERWLPLNAAAHGARIDGALNWVHVLMAILFVGWILMGVGLASVLLSMLFWSTWAGPGYFTRTRRTTYVDEGPAGPGPGY